MSPEIEIWNNIAMIRDDKYFSKWIKETGRLNHHLGFLDFLCPFLGGVALDVGANIGTHSIFYAEFGHVHCFEPNPIAYECLKHNMQGTDSTLYNVAVGATSSHVSMSPQEDSNPGAMYVIPDGDIPMITIDSLQLDACNFVKIDVEGSELDVLEGAKETLKAFKPIICVECNPHTLARRGLTSKDLVALIYSLGYICKTRAPEDISCDLLCTPTG